MALSTLIKRNCKIFFTDKVMFLTSLITPVILLVLYVTFLGDVYKDVFTSILKDFTIDEKLINGAVGGQLVSSILAVSCVTVSFCSNLLMVNDKHSGINKDFLVSPTPKYVLYLSYFISTAITTLIVCYTALAICLVYIGIIGWYLSLADVILLIFDVLILVLFGTALSSIINYPLSTAGQGSAVGTIVSSGYGFICGAYMPISNFSIGLQRTLMFLPGTYGTALIRNHSIKGVFLEMEKQNLPQELIEGLKASIDCNLSFFGKPVPISAMYIVMIASVAILIGIYILINLVKLRKSK